ncbi:lipopolysaccharide-induced tumor necrosis factor-alpha factor homolog [Helicoverpa zea]|uniref:lipopolysaccharide-induced tumor necrosis factor-alpha factor homolog n=1 Tax=Helicoverpa zea TaxID=7113 RepID=UPI001F58B660|nr:lipopolysaccharide-induced tumor necrosis factor-alpha factor homolog [Helicoverpa zea]
METSNAYHPISPVNETVAGIEMELLHVGSEPVGMRCPYCYEDVMTKAHYRNTRLTHTIAVILGIFFWWLCCCLIPYFVKRWKNVEHYCPNCRRYLGMYSRRPAIL